MTGNVRAWLVWASLGGLFAGGTVWAQQTGGAMTGGTGTGADLPIAVQMYTLRDYGSVEEQFQFAADSGFQNVETVGTHDLSAEEMNTLSDETGLSVISTHVDLNTLRTDLEGVIAFNEAIGNTNIVMPYLGEEDRPQDAAGWQELGAELDGIGAQLKQAGMQLAYHNHDFEMEEVEGELIIDHILNAADPENLMWQADVAWIDRGGQDPAQLLSDHAGRVISIHAKDNYPEGEGEDEGGFATVGSGRLDWDAILPAASEAGVQYYIVEHDQPADYGTIADSHEFLSSTLPGVLGQ
ncbi:sugar phosphate isomerase/epimerase [soil metagenome]